MDLGAILKKKRDSWIFHILLIINFMHALEHFMAELLLGCSRAVSEKCATVFG